MKRGKDEMARGRRFKGQADCFEIPHFSYENDIGVLAQRTTQARGERFGMGADLPVVHDAALALMHKLDGIFEGDDVILPMLVGMIEHGSKRRGFAASGWTRDEDQTFVQHAR